MYRYISITANNHFSFMKNIPKKDRARILRETKKNLRKNHEHAVCEKESDEAEKLLDEL